MESLAIKFCISGTFCYLCVGSSGLATTNLVTLPTLARNSPKRTGLRVDQRVVSADEVTCAQARAIKIVNGTTGIEGKRGSKGKQIWQSCSP
jgi:hypothetical protein